VRAAAILRRDPALPFSNKDSSNGNGFNTPASIATLFTTEATRRSISLAAERAFEQHKHYTLPSTHTLTIQTRPGKSKGTAMPPRQQKNNGINNLQVQIQANVRQLDLPAFPKQRVDIHALRLCEQRSPKVLDFLLGDVRLLLDFVGHGHRCCMPLLGAELPQCIPEKLQAQWISVHDVL
jgi:hypothetical protein